MSKSFRRRVGRDFSPAVLSPAVRRIALSWVAVSLGALLVSGCATSRAIRNAEQAAARGDYDTAVAYYRQALAREPRRVDFRIALERSTREAAAYHIKRARELEAQDQLAGALAEYKLAADLDPASPLAASRASEIDRRIRSIVEASRPQARLETLRQQAQQLSPIPRIDPRTRVSMLQFNNAAVRDVLKGISDLTGINVTYDQAAGANLTGILSQPFTIDIRDMSLEDVLNQVMQATTLTFKVVNPQTIFVYQDNPSNRQKYEDQYLQNFYISHGDAKKLLTLIQQTVTVTGGIAPKFTLSEDANAIVVKASAPVLELVDAIIRTNDRPVPEVMVEAEILEVDRAFLRQLGLDLSQYAAGFTFSPELAPPNSGTTPNAFPSQPPPFNLNTISRGVSASDFYVTSPAALIRLLESNNTTKVLAKPQSRGRAGQNIKLTLGDSIPLPQTSFQSIAAGGLNSTPVTQVQYTEVGINLAFTPQVSYQDEIVLDGLILEKSGLGAFITVAGQEFPTISRRRIEGSLRLRDGESNLIAGLLRDDDRRTLKSFPGITGLPLLRALFGNSDTEIQQTDIVMILTPHIVRSRELTPDDLKPRFVGAGNAIGGSAPALISLDAIGANTPGAGAAPAGGPGAQPVQAPPPGAVNIAPSAPVTGPGAVLPPPSAPRAPGVVPIEAVPSTPAAPAPQQPTGAARITLTAPTAGPDGALAAGAGPFTVPITIAGSPGITTLSLTLTYNTNVLRTPTVTQGTFMAQGGVTPTFAPRVDPAAGRIDIVLSRPAGQPGAANNGLIGAIAFMAGAAGTTDVAITGVATGPSGQSVALEFAPIRLVVK